MTQNITYENMIKYLNQLGDLGWIGIGMICHASVQGRSVLPNTLITVYLAREKVDGNVSANRSIG